MKATHLERAAIALQGAANSCVRAFRRQTLSPGQRCNAARLRVAVLALRREVLELEEAARVHREEVRQRNEGA
jgi:hypothetical protein